MLLFQRVEPLRRYLDARRTAGARLGFVPTMGALHQGHVSLIQRAKAENDLTICSIFVNPTQFNQSTDLEKYPRTPSKDIETLLEVGTDVLFMPTETEIYPSGLAERVDLDLGLLDRILEGEFRPGHFAGVATVVKRLLDIVEPQRLYMGQKDYQQCIVVRRLIEAFQLPVSLVVCPIIREPDGLAMSSRNQRLTPEFRRRASAIFRVLQQAGQLLADLPPDGVEKFGLQELAEAGLRPEYFEIVDGDTLQPVEPGNNADRIVACAAAWAGDVRLIDNLILRDKDD